MSDDKGRHDPSPVAWNFGEKRIIRINILATSLH
jgi:hypothetical protein